MEVFVINAILACQDPANRYAADQVYVWMLQEKIDNRRSHITASSAIVSLQNLVDPMRRSEQFIPDPVSGSALAMVCWCR